MVDALSYLGPLVEALAIAFAGLVGLSLVLAALLDWREKRQWRKDSEAIRRRLQ